MKDKEQEITDEEILREYLGDEANDTDRLLAVVIELATNKDWDIMKDAREYHDSNRGWE